MNLISRCSEALTRIDKYLVEHQKADVYYRWLERYDKKPSDHDDSFIFGKLVQAIFSGGMKGQIVDQWMPIMKEAFHGWNIHWTSQLSESDVDDLISSGKVIANQQKLKAVVRNALITEELISTWGSFGNYLGSFENILSLAADLTSNFDYIGKVTVEDFLRNVGFDTAKPDRHLLRWLSRMGAINKNSSDKEIIEMIIAISGAAQVSRARFDSAIYLFCADRNDVLDQGICGNIPDCLSCPVIDLCEKS